ncbi:hypothetical protein NKH37_11270 [Mesorhizobium sp. M1217]|uniref:hypothetical protein n=1 Tax=Mesorhizobium sp. M1217 TaxID=2957070 RepID=UPI00333933A3
MTTFTHRLAEGTNGDWVIVFEPDELHLYIAFVAPGATAEPADSMTIDDFLARRPQGPTHRVAIDKLVGLLETALGRTSPRNFI